MAERLRAELTRPYVTPEGEATTLTNAERIAEVYVAQALDGNLAAAQWIVDRTEGKVAERVQQTLGATVEHRAPRSSLDPGTVDAVLAEYARAGGALPGGG
jgi:hypothetical protein